MAWRDLSACLCRIGCRTCFRPSVRFGTLTFSFGLVLDFVDLAVGRGGGIDHAAGSDFEGLHLQFLRLKNDGGVAVGRNAVDARGRSCGGVDVSRVIRGDGPDVGRRRGVEQLERGSEFQAAGTADGDSGGRALGEVVEFGLLPGAGAVGEGGRSQEGDR